VTPLVIGHRGAMGAWPENTMLSFEQAVASGADWVELDVHLSRDGVPVVIHDPTLERTTSGSGLVADYSLADLQALDAGQGQRIPTLEQVLCWARDHHVGVDIEVKHSEPEPVVQLVERFALFDQVLVSTFDHVLLRRFRDLEPRLGLGALYAHRPVDPLRIAAETGAAMLLPHWSYVVGEDVAAIHAAGLRAGTWATSEPSVLRRLIAAGVDAIATNDPEVLRQIIDLDC
jgi:glycerophosphoryl diester phosphodiesterase